MRDEVYHNRGHRVGHARRRDARQNNVCKLACQAARLAGNGQHLSVLELLVGQIQDPVKLHAARDYNVGTDAQRRDVARVQLQAALDLKGRGSRTN